MSVHDIRHELTKLNKHILQIREISTQTGVIEGLDRLISEVCSIGDKLE